MSLSESFRLKCISARRTLSAFSRQTFNEHWMDGSRNDGAIGDSPCQCLLSELIAMDRKQLFLLHLLDRTQVPSRFIKNQSPPTLQTSAGASLRSACGSFSAPSPSYRGCRTHQLPSPPHPSLFAEHPRSEGHSGGAAVGPHGEARAALRHQPAQQTQAG